MCEAKEASPASRKKSGWNLANLKGNIPRVSRCNKKVWKPSLQVGSSDVRNDVEISVKESSNEEAKRKR